MIRVHNQRDFDLLPHANPGVPVSGKTGHIHSNEVSENFGPCILACNFSIGAVRREALFAHAQCAQMRLKR